MDLIESGHPTLIPKTEDLEGFFRISINFN